MNLAQFGLMVGDKSSLRAASFRRRLLLLIVGGSLLALGRVGHAAAQHKRFRVHPKSQFWIQGEATTGDFTCRVGRVEGRATLPAMQRKVQTSADGERTTVVVQVPVRAFDCGNRVMTNDLQEALQMKTHPYIRFALIHASVGTRIDTSGHWRRIRVLGALKIAGTKRVVDLAAKGRALDENRVRVRGCRPLRMTDFNIKPPKKALGLIKVKDRVVVQFDLLAYAPATTAASPFRGVSVDGAPSCSG